MHAINECKRINVHLCIDFDFMYVYITIEKYVLSNNTIKMSHYFYDITENKLQNKEMRILSMIKLYPELLCFMTFICS